MKIFREVKRYFIYLVRWQLSTPILAVCLIWLSSLDKWTATIVANLIGGLIFYWIDRFIFKSKSLNPVWEVKREYTCDKCGKIKRCYRLIKTSNYDKTNSTPKFFCEKCSDQKLEELSKEGIEI